MAAAAVPAAPDAPQLPQSPLARVRGFTPGIIRELARHGVRNAGEVLLHGDIALASTLNVSVYVARELLAGAAAYVCPPAVPASALLARETSRAASVPSPLAELDAALLGGLPPSITEVVGAAGAGKTQFCLSCAARCALRHLCPPTGPIAATPDALAAAPAGAVLYIDTEGAFDPKRLRQMLAAMIASAAASAAAASAAAGASIGTPGTPHKAPHRAASIASAGFGSPASDYDFMPPPHAGTGAGGGGGGGGGHAPILQAALSRVLVQRVGTVDDLVAYLAGLESLILSQHVVMIILDSVAAVIRRQYEGAASAIVRSESLARLASSLKAAADVFHLPVIVTNQIAVVGSGGGLGRGGGGAAAEPTDAVVVDVSAGGGGDADLNLAVDSSLAPALGPTWAHAVNSRLYLTRAAGGGGGVLTILKSAVAPHLHLPYAIAPAGFVSAPPRAP